MLKRWVLFPGMLLALALLLSGCGSGRLQTKIHVLKNGAPYPLPEGDILRVMLVPVPEGKERVTDFYAAKFNPDEGTFQAAGRDLQGVPPGKYRIAIEHLHNKADVFKGAFDAERSPFVKEINNSTAEITVDVAKPK